MIEELNSYHNREGKGGIRNEKKMEKKMRMKKRREDEEEKGG